MPYRTKKSLNIKHKRRANLILHSYRQYGDEQVAKN
jgi:hypothetical protein